MGIVYGQGLLVAFLSLKFQTTGIPSNSAAWQAMSLALPATLSMKSLLNDSPDVNFWLKYWVVFTYYYGVEYMADVFLSWLPFYSELKLMLLFMAAPVSLFSVTKILRGIPLNEMTINRGPTEGLFELICDLYSSGRASAKRVGLTSTRLQHFVKQLMALSADGLNFAGIAINYFVARNTAIAENHQRSSPREQHRDRRKQSVRIEYIETSSSSLDEEEYVPEPPRTRSRKRMSQNS